MTSLRKLYFSAGPAKIPAEVMVKIHSELLDYKGTGMSVLELGHRSKTFEAINRETESSLRRLLDVPDNYSILFMHGGAKTQFDSVAMNLCSDAGRQTADYIINGSWSKMAADDAVKYAKVNRQLLKSDKFNRVPRKEELDPFKDAAYRYYCDNETIEGLEFDHVPCSESSVPLVCDMTSNFLSRPVDVSKYGVIFAGAQKNCGIAGLAIVIVRKDLIGKQMPYTPTLQKYEVIDKYKSLYNTPLTFAIYIAGLCAEWILERGGLDAMDKLCKKKSGMLYDAIDKSGGFYYCPVEKRSRSRTNVVFLLERKDLNSKFIEESEGEHLYDLKGHRLVGGFRASLYHGISVQDVERLIGFMNRFRMKYTVDQAW